MNITDITEADEAQIGLCPCGKGYNGHADHTTYLCDFWMPTRAKCPVPSTGETIEGVYGPLRFCAVHLPRAGEQYKLSPTLEALRTPGLHYVYPRPLRYPDISAVIYCPLCNCEKSGDVDEPNTVGEQCDDADCRCHEGGEK